MRAGPASAAKLRRTVRANLGVAADLTMRIAGVPAPTGFEQQRADFVASLFDERGYAPELDDVGNVYAKRGNRGGPMLLLAAHLDTVFSFETPLKIERRADRLHGPGVGDNSLGVAALLAVADCLDQLEAETASDIVFVADVGEEGLGNLRGIRAAIDRYAPDLGAVVAVEGHNLGRVTIGAVGSRRIEVTVRGPGGHSWGAFGAPSAIDSLARIIAAVSEVKVPARPRTTFNVGMIRGGTSINTIAPNAACMIDMRSVDDAHLRRLSKTIEAIVKRENSSDIATEITLLGERPAGMLKPDLPVISVAAKALRHLGIEPTFDVSSTDANIPISMGIPSFCIGITRGAHGHTVDEYVSIPQIETGLAQLLYICLNATAVIAREKSSGQRSHE